MSDEVKANQRWLSKRTGQTVRVMGVIEKYVLFRLKGCGPGLQYMTDFLKNFEQRPEQTK